MMTITMKSFVVSNYDIHCIIAAFLFLLSNLLGFIVGIRYRYKNTSKGTYATLIELDPTLLEEQWAYRSSQKDITLAYGFINAIAWFLFVIPIIKLSWILSNAGRQQLGTHITIVWFAMGGAITEFLTRVLELGIESASTWIASAFNLDNWIDESPPVDDMIGWRTLEVVYIITRNMLLWVDACESLFLFVVLTFFYFAIQYDHKNNGNSNFSTKWSLFGIIIGILCLFDFFASLLRYKYWTMFSNASFFIEVLNKLILFPTWLIWLGRQLPKAQQVFQQQDQQQQIGTTTKYNNNNNNTNSLPPLPTDDGTESTFT